MQKEVPDFELLNAYIDGELDVEQSAAVAHAIANDRELAQEVDVLSKLKSTVIDSVDIPELALPAISPPCQPYRPWGIAACFAVLMLVSGLAIKMTAIDNSRNIFAAQEWLPRAWQLHNSWVALTPDKESKEQTVKLIPASSLADLNGMYIPDLSSAKLSVAYITDRHLYGGNPSLLVGYTGTRGCKLSLLIAPKSASLSEKITYFERDQVSLYGWQVGELSYMLMAEGMATLRLKSIADAAYQATRLHLPMDNKTRLALAESRSKSVPCLA